MTTDVKGDGEPIVFRFFCTIYAGIEPDVRWIAVRPPCKERLPPTSIFALSYHWFGRFPGTHYNLLMEHRQRVYRTRGVVLKRRNQGDADRILTVFTPDRGKLELIAKGIRKTTSRKAGHLESFTHVSLLVAQARTWDIITEAVTVESYRHIRKDLEAISQAAYVCELLDNFTEVNDENRLLWDILLVTLRELDRVSQVAGAFDSQLLLRWYELHLLSLSGFQPQLFNCLASNQELKNELNYLSIQEGGVYAPDYGAQLPHTEPIDADTLKILRHVLRNSWPDLASLQVRTPLMMRVDSILHRMMLNILERQLKSVDFLRKVRRLNASTGDTGP